MVPRVLRSIMAMNEGMFRRWREERRIRETKCLMVDMSASDAVRICLVSILRPCSYLDPNVDSDG